MLLLPTLADEPGANLFTHLAQPDRFTLQHLDSLVAKLFHNPARRLGANAVN